VSFQENDPVQATRVLVISSEVKEGYQFTNAAQSHIRIVNYDYNLDSLEIVAAKIENILKGVLADSIGFINHGEAGSFHLTNSSLVSAKAIKSGDNSVRIFWEKIANLVKTRNEQGSIDLFACSLAATPEGKDLIEKLEDITDRNFAASVNLTGNPDLNGDWILETDNINLAARYFESKKLPSITTTLATINTTIPWLDGVNTYFSLPPATFFDSTTFIFGVQFVPAIPRFYPTYRAGIERTNGVAAAATGARLGALDYNNPLNQWFTLFDVGNSSHNHNFRIDYRFYKDGGTSATYIQFVSYISYDDPNVFDIFGDTSPTAPKHKAHHLMKIIGSGYAFAPDEKTIFYVSLQHNQGTSTTSLNAGIPSSSIAILNKEIIPNPEFEPYLVHNCIRQINYQDQPGPTTPTATAVVSTLAADLDYTKLTSSGMNITYANTERTKLYLGRAISDTSPQYAHVKIDYFHIWVPSIVDYVLEYDWNTTVNPPVLKDRKSSNIATYIGTPLLTIDDRFYTVPDYRVVNGTTPLIPPLQRILGDLNEIKQICLSKPTFLDPQKDQYVTDVYESLYYTPKRIATNLRDIATRLSNYATVDNQPLDSNARNEIAKIIAILNDTNNIPNFSAGTAAANLQTLENFFKAQSSKISFSAKISSILQYIENTIGYLQADKISLPARAQGLTRYISKIPILGLSQLALSSYRYMTFNAMKLGNIIQLNKRALSILNRLSKILGQEWKTNDRGQLCCNYKDSSGFEYKDIGYVHYTIPGDYANFPETKATHFGLACYAFSVVDSDLSHSNFTTVSDVGNLISCWDILKDIFEELYDVQKGYYLYNSTDTTFTTTLGKVITPLQTIFSNSWPTGVGEHYFQFLNTDVIAHFYETDVDGKLVNNGLVRLTTKFNTYDSPTFDTAADQYRAYYRLVMWWEGRDDSAKRLSDNSAKSLVSSAIKSIQSANETYQQNLKTIISNNTDIQKAASKSVNDHYSLSSRILQSL
jgi:hypothetical protein